jgi:hypothetical protein
MLLPDLERICQAVPNRRTFPSRHIRPGRRPLDAWRRGGSQSRRILGSGGVALDECLAALETLAARFVVATAICAAR